jgi:hypothetical protein
MERRQLGQRDMPAHEERGGPDEQGIGPFALHAFERCVDLVGGVGSEDLTWSPKPRAAVSIDTIPRHKSGRIATG